MLEWFRTAEIGAMRRRLRQHRQSGGGRRLTAVSLALAVAFAAEAALPADRTPVRPRRRAAPRARFDEATNDTFLDDAFATLSGDRPEFAPAEGTRSAAAASPPTAAEAVPDGFRWSSLVSEETLTDEIKNRRADLAAAVAKSSDFKGGGYDSAREALSTVALAFGVIAAYDQPDVRWRKDAATAHLFARAGANCKVGTDQSFTESNARLEDLESLIQGSSPRSGEAKSYVYDAASLAKIAATKARLAAADEAIKQRRPNWQAELAAWEQSVAAGLVPWTPIDADEMFSGGLLTHPVQQPDKSVLMLGHRDNKIFMVATPALQAATGLQIEALTHRDLLMGGPARDEFWALDEVQVFLQQPGSDKWEPVKLVHATADFSNPERTEPVVDAEGKPQGEKKVAVGPVAALIDGVEQSAWEADRGGALRHQPSVAVVQFAQPLVVPEKTKLKLELRMAGTRPYAGDRRVLGCFRASRTTQPAPTAPPITAGR